MTDTTTPLDHMNAAIAALDTEIADINARQVALADRADELGAARRDLVELRDRFPGAVPAGDPGKPQSVAPDATSARQSARRSAPPKKKAAAKKAARSTSGRYDYAEVARLAREAIEAGKSSADAVMEHYGCSRQNASQAISTARKKGHTIPRSPRAPRVAGETQQRREHGGGVTPFERPAADDVAALEEQAGLPT